MSPTKLLKRFQVQKVLFCQNVWPQHEKLVRFSFNHFEFIMNWWWTSTIDWENLQRKPQKFLVPHFRLKPFSISNSDCKNSLEIPPPIIWLREFLSLTIWRICLFLNYKHTNTKFTSLYFFFYHLPSKKVSVPFPFLI